MMFLLALAGPMTVIPLFLYVKGVELSGLGPAGMIFYITPTFQFLLGYFYYDEVFSFEKFFWSQNKLDSLFLNISKKENKIGLEQIFFVGFDEYQKSNSIEDSKKVMEITISRHEEKLENKLSFLSTVASVSPFIGLFGTVWGIMNAFGGLSQLTQVSITVVAPGISEALVATALGLFTAIPALISYNWNVSNIDKILKNYSNFSEEFLIVLSKKDT